MAEDSTRQGHLETTCLRPTTGHNGCLMMNDDDEQCLIVAPPIDKGISSYYYFSSYMYSQHNNYI